MSSIGWRVGLSGDEQSRIRELIAAAKQADGVAPVGDQVLRELGHDRSRHLVARDGDEVTGYLNLTETPAMAELVVHPNARRHGIGAAMARTGLSEGGDDARIWAHGNLAAGPQPRVRPRSACVVGLLASSCCRCGGRWPTPPPVTVPGRRPDHDVICGAGRRCGAAARPQCSVRVDGIPNSSGWLPRVTIERRARRRPSSTPPGGLAPTTMAEPHAGRSLEPRQRLQVVLDDVGSGR